MLKVTTDPLSIDEAYAAVRRRECGAVAFFVGVVRDHHDGKKVVSISYSAFREMAEKEFARIADEARSRWKVGEIYIAHRTGALAIGDASVVIAVSAPHRAEAFEATRFGIEELKRDVPIWKKEALTTGDADWVMGA